MKLSLYLTALITSLLSSAVVVISAEWDNNKVPNYFPSAEISKEAYFCDGANEEILRRDWTPADHSSDEWNLQSGIIIIALGEDMF